MNTLSKNKMVIMIIGILLITNIVLLSVFLSNKPDGKKGEHKNQMTDFLQNEIGFNYEQMAEFEFIRSDHRSQVKNLFDKMRSNKEKIFKELGTKFFADSAIINAAIYSAMQQKELEMEMLKHLKNIRNICTPQQMIKFDTGFYKVMSKGKEHSLRD